MQRTQVGGKPVGQAKKAPRLRVLPRDDRPHLTKDCSHESYELYAALSLSILVIHSALTIHIGYIQRSHFSYRLCTALSLLISVTNESSALISRTATIAQTYGAGGGSGGHSGEREGERESRLRALTCSIHSSLMSRHDQDVRCIQRFTHFSQPVYRGTSPLRKHPLP